MKIYKITNKINGKCYIGQTIMSTPKKRWTAHCCRTSKSIISQAIQKYGKENFTFEVIAEASSLEELNEMEKFNIAANRSLAPEGYNIASGGEGVGGKRPGWKNTTTWTLGQHPSSKTEWKSGQCPVSSRNRPVKVKCIETNVIYNTITEAANSVGGLSPGIIKVLKGERKRYKGFHWKKI